MIGQSSSGPAQIPLYIALDQDFFKKAGLDVSSQTLSGGSTSAAAAFVNGSVNMLNSSAPEIIQYFGKKILSGKAFAEVTDQSYDVIGKGITSIPDIKGKTIGISAPNAADHIYLLAILQHYGLAPTDVIFISAGNPLQSPRCLDRGRGPDGSGKQRPTRRIDKGRNHPSEVRRQSGLRFQSNMFIATDDLIKNHKPLLKDVRGGAATTPSHG